MREVHKKKQGLRQRIQVVRYESVLALICIILWGLVPGPSPAQEPPGGPANGTKNQQNKSGLPNVQELARILEDPCLRKTQIGLRVISLETGKVLFDHRGEELFIPASTIKLVTTAAALSRLGTHYTFQTHLYTDGEWEGSTLLGNLYLKGLGDPKLVTERLWLMARDVKSRGLEEIEGDLVADDSYFDDQRWEEAWPHRPAPLPSYARIGALSLNFNTVTVHVEPAHKVDQPARVIIEPPTSYVQLMNRTRTRKAAGGSGQTGLVVGRTEGPEGDLIVASGTVPLRAGRTTLYRTISDPSAYTAKTFRELLLREGVKVKGKVVKGKVPPTASVLATYSSEPLFSIVQDLNKFSNNFIAEQILKTLGAEAKGEPGTTAKGLEVLREFLAELGIRPQGYRLADGSGLSRLSRLSPAQVVRILQHMYQDFSLRSEYLSSLAVMGEDGSLRRRLVDTPAQGQIRAKTGTLDGVRCLSGYTQTQKGEPLAFSFLINFGQEYPSEKIVQLQNKVCLLLASSTELSP